jgi:ABC-type polysaccharide/polyol phosphate export permease
LSIVPEGWRQWYVLDPVVGLVDAFRATVVGRPWDPSIGAASALLTCILLPAAYVLFKRIEATVADTI